MSHFLWKTGCRNFFWKRLVMSWKTGLKNAPKN
ncbi:MAG: hypothetical protein DPW09_45245 [Anaerolineae bacterium]|nr:hypothetical protein [Anaerolineae bacterium]